MPSTPPRAMMLLFTIPISVLGFSPPPRELQTTAPTPPIPGCVDHLPECHQFAEDNRCDTDSIFMSKLCPRSCGHCEEECVDSNILCGYWADNDHCRKNPSYMHEECQKSCGKCGLLGPAPQECPCFNARDMIGTSVDMVGNYVKTDQTCNDGSSVYKHSENGEEWFAWYYANSKRWGIGRAQDICTDLRYAISGVSEGNAAASPCVASSSWMEWTGRGWETLTMSIEELSTCPRQ